MMRSRRLHGVRIYLDESLLSTAPGFVHVPTQFASFLLDGTSIHRSAWRRWCGRGGDPASHRLVRRMAGVGPAMLATLLWVVAPEQIFWARTENTFFAPVGVWRADHRPSGAQPRRTSVLSHRACGSAVDAVLSLLLHPDARSLHLSAARLRARDGVHARGAQESTGGAADPGGRSRSLGVQPVGPLLVPAREGLEVRQPRDRLRRAGVAKARPERVRPGEHARSDPSPGEAHRRQPGGGHLRADLHRSAHLLALVRRATFCRSRIRR